MAITVSKGGLSFKEGPKHEILLLSLLAVIVVLIYAPSLTTPFIFDDISNIRDNPHIRLTSLSLKNLTWAGFHSPIVNRPVANISFALNYYVHGYNPVGFHVVNVLIHIATGFFLYFLAKATLLTPALKASYRQFGWIPFFTVFIWIVHPLQTQSVTYLVQRMNSLAAMFYILSMLLYVRFRLTARPRSKWLLLAGCALSGLLAFGTKEISATLPGFILLYEWYFFQGLSRQWGSRHLLILLGFGLLILLISMIYFKNAPLARILSSYDTRDFTMTQRVLTQFRVVIFYISLLIWPRPSRLNLDHDFALSYSLTDPTTTLFAALAIMVLIVLAILTARRDPLLSFGILWFFGNLAIESSVIGLELVFEHRNYLPSMLGIMLMVALVLRYIKPVWLGVIPLCIVGTLFTAWTYQRNTVWVDEITLYQDCVEKSPAKARPHNNLGAALLRGGRVAEAVKQFRRALDMKHDYADAHYNLGTALARQGELEQGIQHFSETLRLEPRNLRALNNMGVALLLLGRYGEAMEYLEAALKINPSQVLPRNNLGAALVRGGRVAEAVKQFRTALDMKHDYADAHYNLGSALARQGELEQGIRHFSETLRLQPKHLRALNDMGVALVLLGRYREAMEYLEAALKINPSDADVHSNLGFALKRLGDPDGAVRHLSKALAIDPDHADALNNLGLVLKDQGQIDAAYKLFARALQINPNLEQARRNLAEIEKQRQDDGKPAE